MQILCPPYKGVAMESQKKISFNSLNIGISCKDMVIYTYLEQMLDFSRKYRRIFQTQSLFQTYKIEVANQKVHFNVWNQRLLRVLNTFQFIKVSNNDGPTSRRHQGWILPLDHGILRASSGSLLGCPVGSYDQCLGSMGFLTPIYPIYK